MAATLFSSAWYRVAQLQPRIHRHTIFHRHSYRGQTWHVVEDRTAERFHRFAPATYFLIGLMDGQRTVDAIWRAAIEKLGDYAPSQDEVIRLLAQLHAADLIKVPTTAEADELFRRYQALDRQSWAKWLSAPFAMRTPLLNPDRFLDALRPVLRPLFTAWGFVAWLAVVVAGAVLAVVHGAELTNDVADRLLAPWNLAALALAYPLLKLCHELGHACAVKAWGGRVQDIGVMFIVFMPVPYVDASASSSFTSKWRRIVVDSAGIMVELLLASVALFFWIDAEPGPWRGFLYNVIVIGTVSTLLFNGNPLLKFDGYYILADYLEIPNLAPRAGTYLGYLIDRYLFGLRHKTSPASAPGERFWFLLYAPLAALYRVFLTASIAFFLATQYMLVGVVMAIWALGLMGVMPIVRTAKRLYDDPETGSNRVRIASVLGTAVAAVVAAAVLMPFPHTTIATGVAIVPDRGSVRAGAEGFITAVLATPDAPVAAGAPLLRLSDPTVDTEARADAARLAALEARLASIDFSDAVEAGVVREDIKAVTRALAQDKARQADQTVTAPTGGVFRLPEASDRPGRFVKRGETLGFVQEPGRLTLSVIVDQVSIGDIQNHLAAVAIWPVGLETGPLPARVSLMHPGGTTVLPSPALATEGGGDIPVDPRRPGELRTLANMFQVELEPLHTPPAGPILIGRHYLVRFAHAPEPFGRQLWRVGRRFVLDRFGV